MSTVLVCDDAIFVTQRPQASMAASHFSRATGGPKRDVENEDYIAANGADAERLGSIDRVSAERHGAIRVGSPRELAQAARIFAGFGMHPVGFYDLRDAAKSSVPVVSTAFRPIDADEVLRASVAPTGADAAGPR